MIGENKNDINTDRQPTQPMDRWKGDTHIYTDIPDFPVETCFIVQRNWSNSTTCHCENCFNAYDFKIYLNTMPIELFVKHIYNDTILMYDYNRDSNCTICVNSTWYRFFSYCICKQCYKRLELKEIGIPLVTGGLTIEQYLSLILKEKHDGRRSQRKHSKKERTRP